MFPVVVRSNLNFNDPYLCVLLRCLPDATTVKESERRSTEALLETLA